MRHNACFAKFMAVLSQRKSVTYFGSILNEYAFIELHNDLSSLATIAQSLSSIVGYHPMMNQWSRWCLSATAVWYHLIFTHIYDGIYSVCTRETTKTHVVAESNISHLDRERCGVWFGRFRTVNLIYMKVNTHNFIDDFSYFCFVWQQKNPKTRINGGWFYTAKV